MLTRAVSDRGLSREPVVMNDAFGGLRAGSPDGTGVAVVCGTGAATGARAPDGRSWHSGWWQEPQGSRQLAEKALRAVLRCDLGVGRPTSLTERVLAMFGCASVEECLHTLTARTSAARGELATFTPILLAEAERGDPTARSIVVEHGEVLGDVALAAVRRVGLSAASFPLVLAGGVFRAEGQLLRRSVQARVVEHEPGAQPVLAGYEPAVGALMLAFDAAGVAVDADVEARLRVTMPPPSLFATQALGGWWC
jgi:N-acetylglucosamine kinase-like BadF-type ATPase